MNNIKIFNKPTMCCTDLHFVCSRDSDSYEYVFDNMSNSISIECKQPAVYMFITMV
jgi:hypothetical protein